MLDSSIRNYVQTREGALQGAQDQSESLQYTIPDNSNWQLDGKQKDYESSDTFFSKNGGTKVNVDKGYKLPHLIEVAITMKFIEQRANTEDRKKLYSFKSITY